MKDINLGGFKVEKLRKSNKIRFKFSKHII